MEVWEIIWKSFLLGTVQGLTEFLPVSSSGHLLLLERLLGFPEGGMTFVNVMLHFGTLTAVLIAFRRDLLALFRPPFRELGLLAVATLPAALAGFFLKDVTDALFEGRGILLLFLLFGVTAVLLLAAELVAAHRKRTRPFGWRAALSMGVMQAVAVLPGISRSGSTIAAGIFAGADTEKATRFSFLMSVPIILGGAAVELLGAIGAPAAIGGAEIAGVVVGILASAGSGFLAIRLMLALIRKTDYKWFALYLLLMSIAGMWVCGTVLG